MVNFDGFIGVPIIMFIWGGGVCYYCKEEFKELAKVCPNCRNDPYGPDGEKIRQGKIGEDSPNRGDEVQVYSLRIEVLKRFLLLILFMGALYGAIKIIWFSLIAPRWIWSAITSSRLGAKTFKEKRALKHSLKLARRGSVESQEKVAYLYHYGKQVQDHTMALAWYSIAKENGSTLAEQGINDLLQKMDANSVSHAKKVQIDLSEQIENESK